MLVSSAKRKNFKTFEILGRSLIYMGKSMDKYVGQSFKEVFINSNPMEVLNIFDHADADN